MIIYYCKVVQWDIMELVCIAGYCLNDSLKFSFIILHCMVHMN